MKTPTLAATALLTLAVTAALSSGVSAQTTLVEMVQAGKTENVLAAITNPDLNVDEPGPDGSTALMHAVYQVDHDLVRGLLEAGADPSATNQFGAAPLTEAVKLADVDMVRMLLEAGADPDSPNLDNQTALMLASSVGSLEIAQLLIDKGADVNAVETFRGQTALMWASAENHPEIAELLVANGADVTPRAVFDDWPRQMTSEPRAQFRATGGLTALLFATRGGCLRCAEAIVEAGADVDRPNPDGITPLINALDNKNFDIAMFLIDQGADVNVWDMNGRTPLYTAIDMNSFRGGGFGGFGAPAAVPTPNRYTALDVARRLIEMGVDVNHQLTRIRPNGPGRGRFADYDMRGGVGPLFIATLSNDHDAMELLLANGAEVDLHNVFRMTPLMIASGMRGTGRRGGPGGPQVQDDAIRSIDLLLDAGADIDRQVTDSHTFTAKLDTYVAGRDQEGRTALMSAAELEWDRVVAHLLERGADPTIRDASGKTALEIAMEMEGPASPARQAVVSALGGPVLEELTAEAGAAEAPEANQ